MQYSFLLVATLTLTQDVSLGAGDHKRTITVDDVKRNHYIHVPPNYDPKAPTAVVLAIHGMGMDGKLMEAFTGLSHTADKHNFVVVYPNAKSLTWNAGQFPGDLVLVKANNVDDVKYLGKVLDDVEITVNVDKKRVYVTGLSNGGMMSYRLASEMSERIAAIAAVAGTMAVEKYEPKRPVSVLHIHGTKDPLVPFNGAENKKGTPNYLKFRSVEDTMMAVVKANGGTAEPKEATLETKLDKIQVVRRTYGKGKRDAEVVLYILEDGGHVWPGNTLSPAFLGKSTNNISANEVIWDFFKKHQLK